MNIKHHKNKSNLPSNRENKTHAVNWIGKLQHLSELNWEVGIPGGSFWYNVHVEYVRSETD